MTQVHDRFSAKPVLSTRKVSSDTGVNLGITLLLCLTEEPQCAPGANFGLISIVTGRFSVQRNGGCNDGLKGQALRLLSTAPRGRAFTCGAGGNSDLGSMTQTPDCWESSERNL